ncbi:MAG: lipid-binding SYLF domain-containing protein [Vicinamibacterales bacterium]
MKGIRMAVLSVTLMAVPLLARDTGPAQGLRDAAAALTQIMDAPGRRIPEQLLERARCFVIVPNLEVGPFVIGTRGRGYVTCRQGGSWSPPGVVTLDAGRIGFRIGGSSTDLVLLVMNSRVTDALLDQEFALGPEGSVAAGPVGLDLHRYSDEQVHADILSWAHSDGTLTGVALDGITLHQDLGSNERLYGRRIENRALITSGLAPPDSASALLAVLTRYARRAHAQ